jgi:hypothetical protein
MEHARRLRNRRRIGSIASAKKLKKRVLQPITSERAVSIGGIRIVCVERSGGDVLSSRQRETQATRADSRQQSVRLESVSASQPQEGSRMKHARIAVALAGAAMALTLCSTVVAAANVEIKGAAILDHPCGKVAVKQMGLVNAGKIDDANKLTTKEMQEQWKALSPNDRVMMTDMMKQMSEPEGQYASEIKSNGLLVVDGPSATLTVQKKAKDASGSSTSTTTQNFKIDAGQCMVSH